MSDKHQQDGREQGQVQTKDRLAEPPRFKVVLHNDDYTSMEFVVFVLQSVFHHGQAAATRIMLNIHQSGIGVAGLYTREIAETRVVQVSRLAREAGHPLQCTMEKAEC
jgi:ATP-dependent Clp protease adaptor protein ClpS